jgi:hypothetical protein
MTLEVIEDFNARTVGVRKSIEVPAGHAGERLATYCISS